MRSAGSGRSMSPLKRRKSAKKVDPKSKGGKKKEATPPRAPSYYKIELVQDHAGSSPGGQQVQLTAGDDSSVQLTPNHNRGLQLASSSVSLGDGATSTRKQRIIRASPIVEHEAVEHELDVEAVKDGRRNGGWTVTNNDGQIVIAMPPSPSYVANSRVAKKKELHCTKELPVFESSAKKTGKKAGVSQQPRDDGDLSVPPRLVKANSTMSHSTSSSSSSEHSFLLSQSPGGGSIGNPAQPPPLPNQGSHPATMGSKGSASASLESPPRMNRSVLDDSLFQDSVDSGSGEASSKEGRDRSRPTSANSAVRGRTLSGGSSSHGSKASGAQGNRGGCGARLPDIFSQILDAFSLGGGCCRQGDTSSSTVAATARV